MYNYYQQQPSSTATMRPLTNPFPLKGHPVSSLEEAKASSIDFDGTIFFFPDIANKKIYTKQVNPEGIAVLNMYELKPIPSDPTPGEYITRTEFEQAINTLIQKFTPAAPQPSTAVQEPQKYKEAF